MILADEPTGNVDPNMSYEIVSLLNEINKRGTTIIMVTHEHHLVRDFGHRVIMIEGGSVVADNEIEPVIVNPEDIAEKASMFTHDAAESIHIPSEIIMEDKQPDIENAGEHDLMSLVSEFAPEKPKNDGKTPLSAAEPKEEVPPAQPEEEHTPLLSFADAIDAFTKQSDDSQNPGEEGDRQ